MVEGAKGLVAKSGNWSEPLKLKGKERTDSYTLSSDLHMCSGVCTCTHTK